MLFSWWPKRHFARRVEYESEVNAHIPVSKGHHVRGDQSPRESEWDEYVVFPLPLQWRKTGKILAALRFVYINLLHLIQWHWCLHQQCWCSCAIKCIKVVLCSCHLFFVIQNPPPTSVRRVLGGGDYRCYFVFRFTFCALFTNQEVKKTTFFASKSICVMCGSIEPVYDCFTEAPLCFSNLTSTHSAPWLR